MHVCGDEIFDAFERKVRIDCSSPVADQERHVMNFAGVTRFDDEANLGALLRSNKMVVNRCGHQQRWNRSEGFVGVSIRENNDACAVVDRSADFVEDFFEPTLKPRST